MLGLKKVRLFFVMLACVVLLTACNDAEPLIKIEATFSPVTDEQYRSIGATKDLIDPKREDFKAYKLNFYMEHYDSVKDRKIEMYDFGELIEALNNVDGISRYWTGGWSSRDNESENFASYDHEFNLYTKGLSEDEIRNAFKNKKITVSWKNSENEQINKEFNLYDLLQFNSNN